jgi:hypothetical protein
MTTTGYVDVSFTGFHEYFFFRIDLPEKIPFIGKQQRFFIAQPQETEMA